MKFLYVGDLHERSTPPRNRKDNWEETYTSKILEIREIAKKNNVKAILHGGDFFSKHKYDTEFLAKVLNRWGYKNYNEKLLEEGVIVKGVDEAPIITPIGNHDLLGSSLKSYEKTSLSFLESIGFVTIANKERPLIFKEDDFSVAITGGHYELDMDETKEPYLIHKKQGDYHIHIVHGMLTDHKWPEGVPHTTLDEILHTNADLTIAGHDHKGFAQFEHEGKIFVNPGSPVRMGTDEIKRKPKVMLIDITDEGIKTKYVYLKSAKPGEEVLDLTHKESKERKSNTLRDIQEKVRENTKSGSSINDIIKSIAQESDVHEDIAQKAIDRVADKISSSKNNEEAYTHNNDYYYIKSMDLVNFGSHERTTFNFNEGLNVFIGATSSGKTTCFRAFKWIYDDDGNSKRFIKKGEDFCEATIATSHGYIITRFIHPKGKKTKEGKTVKNGYEITYPDGDVTVTNTKGVELVKDILCYKKLNLENKEIDMNFLDQGSSWFFIGDRYTSTDRAKMIGSIHNTHYVDLAIKDLEADNKRLNQQRDDKVDEINKIQEKIDSFSYLEDMKNNVDYVNKKKEQLILAIEKRDKILDILNKRNLVEEEISKCEAVISKINSVDLSSLKDKLNILKENQANHMTINTLNIKINEVTSNIAKEEAVIELINSANLVNSQKQLEQLKSNLNCYEKVSSIYEKQNILIENINKCNEILKSIDSEFIESQKSKVDKLKLNIDSYSKIFTVYQKQELILKEIKAINLELEKINPVILEQSKAKLEKLKENLLLQQSITQILTKRTQVANEGSIISKKISQYNEEINNYIIQYEQLLVSAGMCPICNSKIDKVMAKQIAQNKISKQ